jgi:hypothetical protein
MKRNANTVIVERVAAKAGFRTSGFQSSAVMELYYDLAKGCRDIGYISKGWKDPGYRVANILFTVLPSYVVNALADSLNDYCATNRISISVTNHGNHRVVALEFVLYSPGFNVATFSEAMKTFLDVEAKVQKELRLAERGSGRDKSALIDSTLYQ